MQNVYFWWMNPIFGFNFGFQFWDDFNSHTNVMDYLRKSHKDHWTQHFFSTKYLKDLSINSQSREMSINGKRVSVQIYTLTRSQFIVISW